jgi:hypothetical protein
MQNLLLLIKKSLFMSRSLIKNNHAKIKFNSAASIGHHV